MGIFFEALISTLLSILFTYTVAPIVESNKTNKVFFIIISLSFLLFYCLIFSNLPKIKIWLTKIRRKIFPKIAILNGKINSESTYTCEKAWANITPIQWENKLLSLLRARISWFTKFLFWITRQRIVESINTNDINNSFYMILNPFGDNFPEEDCELHLTFSRLKHFMKDGGIFVVTGGAFYLHQNTNTSSKSEQTIVREHITENVRWQSLEDTFLYLKFGISMTSDGEGDKTLVDIYQSEEDKKYIGDLLTQIPNPQVKRFRALKRVSNCDFLPLLREKGNDNFPIALIRQEKGYLLHMGMYLENEQGLELGLAGETIVRLFLKEFEL